MKFLNKSAENLLQESLDRSNDFPVVLAEKLGSASAAEDDAIRSCIKVDR